MGSSSRGLQVGVFSSGSVAVGLRQGGGFFKVDVVSGSGSGGSIFQGPSSRRMGSETVALSLNPVWDQRDPRVHIETHMLHMNLILTFHLALY